VTAGLLSLFEILLAVFKVLVNFIFYVFSFMYINSKVTPLR